MSHFECQIKYLVNLVGTKTQIFFSTFSQIVCRALQHLYSTQNSGPMYLEHNYSAKPYSYYKLTLTSDLKPNPNLNLTLP